MGSRDGRRVGRGVGLREGREVGLREGLREGREVGLFVGVGGLDGLGVVGAGGGRMIKVLSPRTIPIGLAGRVNTGAGFGCRIFDVTYTTFWLL